MGAQAMWPTQERREREFERERERAPWWRCCWLPEPYIGCPYPYPCPCPPIPMGFGWAWVRCYCSWVGISFVHPCIQLQIRVKVLGCKEYANQEALRAKVKTMSDFSFIRSNQNLVQVGNTHYRNFWVHGRNLNGMNGHGWTHVMLWVGMHRSLMMGMVWVWVQIPRKMLGSAAGCGTHYVDTLHHHRLFVSLPPPPPPAYPTLRRRPRHLASLHAPQLSTFTYLLTHAVGCTFWRRWRNFGGAPIVDTYYYLLSLLRRSWRNARGALVFLNLSPLRIYIGGLIPIVVVMWAELWSIGLVRAGEGIIWVGVLEQLRKEFERTSTVWGVSLATSEVSSG